MPGYELGVYVDIFPLDYVTDCRWLRRHVVWKYKKHIYRMRRCKMQSNFLASRWHYLLYRYFPLPLRAIDAIIGHTLTGHKPTGTVCNMTEANVLERECFPAHCIEGERWNLRASTTRPCRATTSTCATSMATTCSCRLSTSACTTTLPPTGATHRAAPMLLPPRKRKSVVFGGRF